MADVQKTIDIVFGAIDNTGGAIQGVGDQLHSLSDSVSSVTGPLSDLADTLVATETVLLAMGVALATVATSAAGEFGDSIANAGTLVNATDEQIEGITAQITEFASNSTSDIGTITDSFYNAVSATGEWSGSMELLAEAEQLAVAGSATLGDATTALSTVLNAYGQDMTHAGAVSNAFTVAVQGGVTTMPQLAAGIGSIAATAAGAGIPIEELMAGMAALTGATSQTAESFTSYRALINELLSPTTALTDVLGGMTLETDGLVPILDRLSEATGGSSAKMGELFGSSEAAAAALILSQDAAGKMEAALLSLQTETDQTKRAYESMVNSFENVNQRLTNNISLSLIALGNDLLPGYADIVAGITDLFASLRISVDQGAFDDLTNFFVAKAGEFGTLFEGIAAALPEALSNVDFSGLVASFDGLLGAVGGVFEAFFGNLDLTNPDELTLVLQKLVDAFEALTTVVSGIIGSWETSVEWISKVVDEITQLDNATLSAIGQVLGLSQQFESFRGLIDNVVTAVQVLGGGLLALAGVGGVGAISTAITAIGGPAGLAAIAAIGTFAAGVYELYQAVKDYQINAEAAKEATLGIEESTFKAKVELAKLNEELGTNYTSLQQYFEATDRAGTATAGMSAEQIAAAAAAQDHERALQETGTRLRDMVQAEEDLENAIRKEAEEHRAAEGAIRDAASAKEHAKNTTQGYSQAVVDGVSTFTQYGTALQGTADKAKALAEQEKRAAEEATTLKTTLLEIASDERIRAMELAVDMNIAQVEADANKVIAAFDSISSTVSSVTGLISDMVGIWADAGGLDQLQLEDWIEEQIEIEKAAMEKQGELIDAQIANMEARTEAMSSGLEVNVTADGLEPEIEAFMWKIVQRLHTQAVGEEAEFLINLS